ncbi:CHAT domain-containing protein [Actinoplanes missouriensis]
MTMPLELAWADGSALARRGDVTLVFEAGDDDSDTVEAAPSPPGPLRMIAVFSLPSEMTALGLRRERSALARMVRELVTRDRRVVELEILQYGVTRDALAARLSADGGPDVLHLSGHGASGKIVLETSDGRPDPVDSDDLLRMLRPAGRLRLAVLSVCDSAAATTAEALRWLQLNDEADAVHDDEAETPSTPPAGLDGDSGRSATGVGGTGIAGQLARELRCAVVAMRYPVADEFAVALGARLYEALFRDGVPVDVAFRTAVPQAAGAAPSAARPPISIATPTLVGARAIDLRLEPPQGAVGPDDTRQRMSAFPPEPQRFLGRAAAMARAGRTLAPDAQHSGVLFHGMPGIGTTSCALELAYRHHGTFSRVLWWQATLSEQRWADALADFSRALTMQLAEPDIVAGDEVILPRLAEVLRRSRVLIVMDNIDTLLSPDGAWGDSRWAALMQTLCAHGGATRVVLTSHVVPTALDATVSVETLHALSRDEAVLLSRELPNLRQLLHPSPAVDQAAAHHDRAQLRRVLELVRGHPKLLEMVDAAAADPARLATLLTAAPTDEGSFLTGRRSPLDGQGHLPAFVYWTGSVAATLPSTSLLLLRTLACLEENDRWRYVLERTWPELCRRWDIPETSAELSAAWAPLSATALVDAVPAQYPDGPDTVQYRMHPVVIEAVIADTPQPVRRAVDLELASYWLSLVAMAERRSSGEISYLIARAALSAAPYLIRQDDRDTAAEALFRAVERDETAHVAQAVVRYMKPIVAASGLARDQAILGKALSRIDRDAGESHLRRALATAVEARDFREAFNVAASLATLLLGAGKLEQAHSLLNRNLEFSRLAGLGPWSRISVENELARLLMFTHGPEQALDEVHRIVERMRELADDSTEDEAAVPAGVREFTFRLGSQAAMTAGRWQEALDFNRDEIASLAQRGAPALAMARTMYGAYRPLMHLDQLEAAESVLRLCQEIFEQEDDLPRLGMTISARADLAAERGEYAAAIELAGAALRLMYLLPNANNVGAGHHNLAKYLRSAKRDPAGQLAHQLAGTLLVMISGQEHDREVRLTALVGFWHAVPATARIHTLAKLADVVGQVPGVRFADLAIPLAGDENAAQETLTRLIRHVDRQPVPDQLARQQEFQLTQWEPILTELVKAIRGSRSSDRLFRIMTDELSQQADWAQLVPALHRIRSGARDRRSLTADLDAIDTAVVSRALERLSESDDREMDPVNDALISLLIGGQLRAEQLEQELTPVLDLLDGHPEWEALASALHRLMGGERNLDSVRPGLDPVGEIVIETLLERLADSA